MQVSFATPASMLVQVVNAIQANIDPVAALDKIAILPVVAQRIWKLWPIVDDVMGAKL
jgi:hypothetical protein